MQFTQILTQGGLLRAADAAAGAERYGFFHRIRYGRGLVGMFFGKWEELPVKLSDGTTDVGTSVSLSPLYYYPTLLLCCLIAYLLGSLNFAIIISKCRFHDDIRKYGSGNAGMTNMLRTYGKGPALLTLLGDFLKGTIAVLLGLLLGGEVCAYLAGFFCILGHSFPIFSHFRGGKGVATTAGVILCLEPAVFGVCFVVFALIVLWTKYVSLASVMGMFVYPMVLSGMYFNFLHPEMAPLAETAGSPLSMPLLISIAVMVLVVFQHRSNIKRLMQGEERKTDLSKLFRKKKKTDEADEAGKS